MRVVILMALLSLLGHCLYPGNQITFSFVTALWRPSSENDQGPLLYNQQLQLLDAFLKTDQNVILFGDEELIRHVMQYRSKKNTVFVIMALDQLKKNSAAMQTQESLLKFSKQNPSLYAKYQNQPQFRSSQYASILFSRPFLLKKALSYNTFNAEYIYWIEPDILHNIQYPQYQKQGDLTFGRQRNILRKLSMHFQLPFIVRSGNDSIVQEGLKDSLSRSGYGNISSFAMTEWFGGRVQAIPTAVTLYEDLLRMTLTKGYWSPQGVFTLMIHRYPKMITQIRNLNPQWLFHFDINGFINRPIRQMRHLKLSEGGNQTTLTMSMIGETPGPIYSTVIRTYENYNEYEILINSFKFRADRERIFLASLIVVYIVVRILKRTADRGFKMAVRHELQGTN